MVPPNCPKPDLLAAYAHGRLPEPDAQGVAEHLETCQSCEATVSRLEGEGDTLVKRLREPDVAPPPPTSPLSPGGRGAGGEGATQSRKPKAESGAAAALPIPNPQSPIPSSPQSPAPTVGRVRDYQLLAKLGEGGMGVVYKAHHASLDKLVALKLLSAKVTGDPEAVARFQQEMRAVGKVDDPHVVRAMDAGQVKGRHYLVMEYVDGINLSDLVRAAGPLRIADACELARQAALGLKAIDAHGLVHRDVKPSNLMLNADAQVKILDLGLAVFAVADTGSQSQHIMGTPDYIAPEQARGGCDIDIRADLYSLGCTLYKLLTGSAPFAGPKYPNSLSRVMGHINDPAPSVTAQRSDVPPKLAALVERLLVKDPALRLPDPGRLAEALKPFCGGADLAGLYAQTAAMPRPPAQPGASQAVAQSQLTPTPAPSVATGPTPGSAPADDAAFDPYHTWLGIPPGPRPPDHYRLLGLERFEENREVIESAVARQSAYVRTKHLGKHVALSQKLLNEISAAKVCLLVPEKKAAYDAALRKKLAAISPLSPGGRGAGGEGAAARDQGGATDRGAGAHGMPKAEGRPTVRLPSLLPGVNLDKPESGQTANIVRRWRRPAIIAAGASTAAIILLAVILSLQTSYGTVKVELSDPKANVLVKIDGETINVAGLDQPLQIKPGEHGLEVKSGGFQTFTRFFSVGRGGAEVVRVRLEPKTVAGSEAPAPALAIAPFDEKKAGDHQLTWAAYLRMPVEMTNSIGMRLVLIPAGSFMMGDENGDAAEKPIHEVTITKPFYMGKHEVTQEQWDAVMGGNPSCYKGSRNPVEMVGWDDVQEFLRRLNGRPDNMGGEFRLPTEAQWEYACRAGGGARFCFGDDEGLLSEYAWCQENSGLGKNATGIPVGLTTHPVGLKRPNAFGLYDMHGNVWEWCADWFDATYYARSTKTDPTGPESGSLRVLRGNCYSSIAKWQSSAIRIGCPPKTQRDIRMGFRVSLVLAEGVPSAALAPGRPGATAGPPSSASETKRVAHYAAPSGVVAPSPAATSHQPPRPPLAIAPFDEKKAKRHQAEWAESLGVRVETANSVGMKLVLVPPGEFMMGSAESPEQISKALAQYGVQKTWALGEHYPQHRVRITKPFLMGMHEATVGQFRRFADSTGYVSDAEKVADERGRKQFTWRQGPPTQTDDHPVVNVSWNDCVAFCTWLSQAEGRSYRLPSEAEWEYACRAGTTTRYCNGDDPELLPRVGNVADAEAKKRYPHLPSATAASDGYTYTAPVGQFQPNAFGLFDMHGNAAEWCADWYSRGYDASSPVDDPRGPSSGESRAFRGGAWIDGPFQARAAHRSFCRPSGRLNGVSGFRIACEVAGGKKGEGREPQVRAATPGGAAPPPAAAQPPGTTASPGSVGVSPLAGEAAPITADLHFSADLPGWGVKHWFPSSVDLSKSPVDAQWIKPPPTRSQRLYGALSFGTTTKVNVVVDVLDESRSTARFALNDDVRFDNKQARPLPCTFPFPVSYPDGSQQPYAIQVYYVPQFAKQVDAYRLHYYRACLREGVIVVGGRSRSIAVLDEQTRGDYSNLAESAVLIRAGGHRQPSAARSSRAQDVSPRSSYVYRDLAPDNPLPVAANSAFKLDGQFYAVSTIAHDGSRITIKQAGWGELRGRIVGEKTQQAIRGATIAAGPDFSATTGSDGRFGLKLPEGEYRQITVTAEGYIPKQDERRFVVAATAPVEVAEALADANGQRAGTVTLHWGDSYHFLAKTMEQFSGGDFYLGSSANDHIAQFWANNRYQGGVVDLGSLGSTPLSQVVPPSTGYTRFGSPVVPGHTYVSHAKEGESGHYVVFRVTSLNPDGSVEIEYHYR